MAPCGEQQDCPRVGCEIYWSRVECHQMLVGLKWDTLFAKDRHGLLAARLEALADGDEQRIMTDEGSVIQANCSIRQNWL